MSVSTIKPITTLETPLSWRGRFALEKVNDERCQMCLAGTAEGGAGLTLGLFGNTSLYAMGISGLRTSPDFTRHKITLEGGPLAGLRTIFTPRLLFQIETGKQWILNFDQPITKTSVGLRWAPNLKWSFEAGYREELLVNQYLGSAYYYF